MSDQNEAFLRSQTKENLMRAFAGESQARNRYTIAAGIAHKAGLAVIQGIFLFTAEQEKSHAKQFYRQLHDLGGQTIRVDGTYPVDIYADLLDYLRAQPWYHDYEVVPSAVTLVELTAKGANKGGMVQRLAQLLDVKRENVLCVGDHANDISMLTWAGEGYAPANAIPLVLNTPGVHHLPDCRDDAIAALVAELDKRF